MNSTLKARTVATCAALVLLTPTFAQTGKKPNIIQRHPTLTGVAAGVVTHAALKKSAAAKKRRHEKLNIAERHPTLTSIAAGVATRAAIKHTTRRP